MFDTPAEIAASRYLLLTTYRRNGAAVSTPVWFAPGAGAWFAFTAADSGKVKRLRHTQTVRIAACDVRGRVKGTAFETRAELVSDPALQAEAYAALRSRYGWQMRVTDLMSWLTGRIHKRAMIRIEVPRNAPAG